LENENEIITKLRSVLKDKVYFAFLFGSAARGELNDESDIDCAVYLKNFSKSFKRFDFFLEISSHFDRPIDIIVLNDADLIISMQVIANGKVIVEEDSKKLIEFKALKTCQYIDYKMSRKIIEDNLMKGKIYA
jgi:predicted nucleotidyltransferase